MGLDGMWSLKAAYLFFWLAAVAVMYLLASVIFDKDGALAAAAAYSLAPYLLVDAYVRGGISEFACFAFLPLSLLGAWFSARDRSPFGPILLAVAYAALTFVHNITALIATPLIALFILMIAANWRAVLRSFLALACGLALVAFFWLPAIAEKDEVHAAESLTGGFFQFANHFVAPAQLFLRRWNFGASIPGPNDKMGFMFGEMFWLALVLGIVSTALLFRRSSFGAIRVRLALVLAAVISLFMTLPWSSELWKNLPLILYVQFPWRFLLLATVFAAPLLAAIFLHLPQQLRPLIAVAMCVLAVAVSFDFVRVRYLFEDVSQNAFVFVGSADVRAASAEPNLARPDRYLNIKNLRRLGVTSTASHDYLPIACTVLPSREPANAAESGGPGVQILSSAWGHVFVRAEVQASEQERVAINQFYFPGWRAKVDGVFAPLLVEYRTGRMIVTVGPGRHAIDVHFGDTPVRTTAKIVSVFGLALLGIWFWVANYIRRSR